MENCHSEDEVRRISISWLAGAKPCDSSLRSERQTLCHTALDAVSHKYSAFTSSLYDCGSESAMTKTTSSPFSIRLSSWVSYAKTTSSPFSIRLSSWVSYAKTTSSPFSNRLLSWVSYAKIVSSPNGEGREGCQPAWNTNQLDSQPFRLRMTERTHCHCEPRSGVAIQCPKYLDCFVCLSLLTPHPSPLPKERENPVINLMPLSQCKTWRTAPC